MLLKTAFCHAAQSRLFDEADGVRPWLIVLGAPVRDGRPSRLLRYRLQKAAESFKQGAAPRILITGDDGRFRCDEVHVMHASLVDLGVPASAMAIDGGAARTLTSLERAVSDQGISEAWVVSQREHLCRALWQAERLGLDASGLVAPEPTPVARRHAIKRACREELARWRAVIDLGIAQGQIRPSRRGRSDPHHRS